MNPEWLRLGADDVIDVCSDEYSYVTKWKERWYSVGEDMHGHRVRDYTQLKFRRRVRRFEATAAGDGVTDDTAAVQAAAGPQQPEWRELGSRDVIQADDWPLHQGPYQVSDFWPQLVGKRVGDVPGMRFRRRVQPAVAPTCNRRTELLKWLKDQCCRYTNGFCQTRRCLVRGGYTGAGSVDYNAATCEPHEVVQMLEAQGEQFGQCSAEGRTQSTQPLHGTSPVVKAAEEASPHAEQVSSPATVHSLSVPVGGIPTEATPESRATGSSLASGTSAGFCDGTGVRIIPCRQKQKGNQ